METRDNAIDATRGIVIGTIVGTPDTPEDRAKDVKYAEAVFKVHDPAYQYNEHVRTCDVCKEDRPQGRYSMPLPTA